MSDQEKRLLQGTYQSILVNACNDTLFKMNNNDQEGAFECLQNLFAWLPNICVKECQQAYNKVIIGLNRIAATKTIGFSQAVIIENNQRKLYLYRANRHLVTLFKTSLDNHGYLEISKGRPPTQTTSLQDIQIIVDKAKHQKTKEKQAASTTGENPNA